MSSESPRILIIDDDADIVRAGQVILGRAGMTVVGAASPDDAWVALAEAPTDVILLDLNFGRGRTTGDEGFRTLDRLLAADRDAVVVIVTGHSGIAVAVRAMKAGAADFVVKPWRNDRLVDTVERAVTLRRARRALASAEPAAIGEQLLGESAAIVAIRETIARVASTDSGVLVLGAAGTGKSLVARLLHAASHRPADLIVLDGAGTLPDVIPEHATVLIEDVETIPRASQRDVVQRLASARILATSRLHRGMAAAALIDDLLYRFSTIEIDLPTLTARGGDTIRLARHFLNLFATHHGRPRKPLSDEAERAIAADGWPDNVRGLRQACERAVLLGNGTAHEIADFGLVIDTDRPAPRAAAADLNLARGEKAMIAAALKRHASNVSRAAAELGLTRAALYRRMEKHGL